MECGAAHGALAMTTPGDTSMATLTEVEKAMKGGWARGSSAEGGRAKRPSSVETRQACALTPQAADRLLDGRARPD